jgi:hypothetical protein
VTSGSTGEPFLFKTHYPHNQIVGGGFFSGFGGLLRKLLFRIQQPLLR